MIVSLLILWHRWLYVTSYTMPMNKGFEYKYNQPNLFRNVEKEKSISKCWDRSAKRKPNLNFSRVIKNSYFDQHWGLPEKIQTVRVGAGGGENIEFPQRYWRKIMWKFQGSIKKEVEFPGLFKNNSYGISMEFLTLEFPRSVTDLAEFSGWKLVFSGISKGY